MSNACFAGSGNPRADNTRHDLLAARCPIYMVNLWAAGTRLALAQRKAPNRNEVAGALELLAVLDLRHCPRHPASAKKPSTTPKASAHPVTFLLPDRGERVGVHVASA